MPVPEIAALTRPRGILLVCDGAQAPGMLAVDVRELQVNPDTYLMAVAIGASCAFLTPIGHQNNTLILGPGGFRFTDYWRLGLPMDVVVVSLSIPLLLWAWPL
jgi:di/tricarboxylate transporter